MKELSEIPAVNQTMNSPTMSIMNKDLSVKNRFKIKRLNKEERRDKFIEENIERLKEKREQDTLDQLNDKIGSLAKQLEHDMTDNGMGKNLDPYQAMLHARKMSKKVSESQALAFFKVSQKMVSSNI